MNQIDLETFSSEIELISGIKSAVTPKGAYLDKRRKTVKKAVVIPAYKVKQSIQKVISTIPAFIDHIIVVDDKCPEGSGLIAEQVTDRRLTVIFHDQNQGVGAAAISGYKKAMEFGCDIIVKMDGDGQMQPEYLKQLILPLVQGRADYTKGNRYHDFKALMSMPKARLVGNNILSFMVKAFSGYWSTMDPVNGYTAITGEALKKLNLLKIEKRYFFEADMLLNLNLIDAVVDDVPIPAKYGDEKSSLKISHSALTFPLKLAIGMTKRIFFKYFIHDFNMASVYMVFGLPMFLWSMIFGTIQWIDSYVNNTPQSAGTIMLAALPLIISTEMLLQAVSIDIHASRSTRSYSIYPKEN